MRKTSGVLLIACFAFVSCVDKSKEQTQNHVRDSLLRQFVSITNNIDYYDTANNNYRFLTAFVENDTNKLEAVISKIKREELESQRQFSLDTCLGDVNILKVNCVEAYRLSQHWKYPPHLYDLR
jgi:hypothetical protein